MYLWEQVASNILEDDVKKFSLLYAELKLLSDLCIRGGGVLDNISVIAHVVMKYKARLKISTNKSS